MTDKQAFKEIFDALATGGIIGAEDGIPAYGYIRVSSHEQADEGRSGLPRQIQHIHEIAAQRGYSITWDRIFADDCSGFEFEDRPALSALRKEYKAASRRASAIVIEALDRLSRNADWHQGYLLDEMKQYHVDAAFWKAFSSRIERIVMGAIAQDGMEQAKERMRDGNRRKAKERQCITAKFAALGLKLVDPAGQEKTESARRDTKYAIDDSRTPLICYVYDALAFQDITTYALVNALDAQAETDPRFRPLRAKGWSEGRILQMVSNPVYKGEFVANRFHKEVVAQYDEATGTYRKVKKTLERPEHEWVRVAVPAIVDVATWDLANKNLKNNKHRSPHNRRHDYLLAGLVCCADCGWRYHGQSYYEKGGTQQIKAARYCCSKKAHIAKQRREPRCTAPSIFCAALDNAVWQIIADDFFSNPDRMMRALDAKYCGEEYQAVKDQIAYIEGQIEANIKTEAQEHALYLAGGYTAEEFAAERRSLITKREKLQAQVTQLQGQILTPEQVEAKKREALGLVEAAREVVDPLDAPFEVRRRAIRAMVDEIKLNAAEGLFEMTGALGTSIHHIEGSAVTTSMCKSDVLPFRLSTRSGCPV